MQATVLRNFLAPFGGHRATGQLFITAGIIEVFGGALIAIGLATRLAAFIASGEMAVAYFMVHIHAGMWPIQNHGEPVVFFCLFFLYLVARGPGRVSLDALLFGDK